MQLSADTTSMHLGNAGLTKQTLNPMRMRKGDRVFSSYNDLNPLGNSHVQPRTATSMAPTTRSQPAFHGSQDNSAINSHSTQALLPGENLLQLKQRLQRPAATRTSAIAAVVRPMPASKGTGSTASSEGSGHKAWPNFGFSKGVAPLYRQALLAGENLLQLKQRLQYPAYRYIAEVSGSSYPAFCSTETGSTVTSARAGHTGWSKHSIPFASTKDSFNRLIKTTLPDRQALLQWNQPNTTIPNRHGVFNKAARPDAYAGELLRTPANALKALDEGKDTAAAPPFNSLGQASNDLFTPAFMEKFIGNPTFRRTMLARLTFVEALAVNPKAIQAFVSHVPELAQELINTPTFLRKLPWLDALELSENPSISHALSMNPKAFVALWSYHPGIEDDDEAGDLLLTRNGFLKNLISHPEFVPAMLEAQTSTSKYLCHQFEIARELGVQWSIAGKLMQNPSLANELLETLPFAKALVATPQIALDLLAYPGFATAFANAFCSESETGLYLNSLTRKLLAYPAFATAFAKQVCSPPFANPVARYHLNRKLIANRKFQAELIEYPYFLNALKA